MQQRCIEPRHRGKTDRASSIRPGRTDPPRGRGSCSSSWVVPFTAAGYVAARTSNVIATVAFQSKGPSSVVSVRPLARE